jgi:hypothetical protein
MSGTLRITALAAALFTMSYSGVAWVIAGTPLPSTLAVSPDRPIQVASLPVALPQLPPPAVQATPVALPRGDGDPHRDQLRVLALQASTAYVRSPCDAVAKVAMVEAVSDYAKAWADMMDCGPDGCDYRKINITAATFSTPLDIELRDTIGAAFDRRGIAIDDFPSSLRINVAMLVRGRGARGAACPDAGLPLPRD